MADLPRKSADDLKYLLAMMLGIDPDSPRALSLHIVPMNDTWRALSGHYDDEPEFRNKVICTSIELAGQCDLET